MSAPESGMDRPPGVERPPVIFRALIENAKKDTTKRFYGRLLMTDHGDHVEWTNGKRTWMWRLPDQPDGGYPTLAGVVLARFGNSYGVGEGSDRITFVDPSGAVLAYFSPQWVQVQLEKMLLPPEAYEHLASRGVTVVREEYRSEKAFYKAHPDPAVTGFALSFARHPFLWCAGVLVVVVVIVNIVMLLNGSYS